MLLAAGVTAFGVAFFFYLITRPRVVAGSAAITGDETVSPASALASPASGDPLGYTVYNLQPLSPEPLAPIANDAPAGTTDGAGTCGCGCGSNQFCYAGNQLGDGYTYASLAQYLDFLKETNPNFIELYKAQMSQYAVTLGSGMAYTGGVVTHG